MATVMMLRKMPKGKINVLSGSIFLGHYDSGRALLYVLQ